MAADLRQSKEWARFLASQGWEVEEVGRAKAYIRKLPIYGSVIKIQRPETIPSAEAIDKLARKHRALFVKLELGISNQQPATQEQLRGFELDKNPNLPTKTIVIDLTKSEEELWQGLSQDARQSIKKAQQRNLKIITKIGLRSQVEFGKLQEFHQLLTQTGRRQGFWTPSFNQLKTKLECFGENAVLFLAYPPSPLGKLGATEGQVPPMSDQPIAGRLRRASPLAGAFNLIHSGISYGRLAASSDTGRKLHAPYLLMWEMIKFFKNPKSHTLSPIRYFDLEGIYDPRYHKLTKGWQGFTAFKRKFGGKEKEYPPPLIKYYHPLIRLLFRVGSLFD